MKSTFVIALTACTFATAANAGQPITVHEATIERLVPTPIMLAGTSDSTNVNHWRPASKPLSVIPVASRQNDAARPFVGHAVNADQLERSIASKARPNVHPLFMDVRLESGALYR